MSSRRGLHLVAASQFFGSLADSALLIVAIELLLLRGAAGWTAPGLRVAFYLGYVLLAPISGAVADAFPKRRVLVLTQMAKLAACVALALGVHPLLAYTIAGVGAAAHAPARYGILLELVPPKELIAANAWLEIATVLSVLLGAGLGAALVSSPVAGAELMARVASLPGVVLAMLYGLAGLCSLAAPARAASDREALRRVPSLAGSFAHALRALWRDPDAGLALRVTSLFWAAAAVLQFIVLRWAMESLHLSLAQATLLQGVVGVGMVAGAAGAGRWMRVTGVARAAPLGSLLGAAVAAVAWVTHVGVACLLMAVIGLLAGALLVPMNALLQLRGQ